MITNTAIDKSMPIGALHGRAFQKLIRECFLKNLIYVKLTGITW